MTRESDSIATAPSGVAAALPPIPDDYETETSVAQQQTIAECLPYLQRAGGPGSVATDPPPLRRQAHVKFLHQSLESFPEGFVGLDAARPWMVYWALTGLYLLGEDVSQYRDRVVKTFRPMQNASGGFGGGHGQYSHLAGTYATVLSLALVGGTDVYSIVDRDSMWRWLGRLKQPDGGFCVCERGEEDVRGAYCALVLVSLLALPDHLPEPISSTEADGEVTVLTTFHDGLEQYLSRCQSWEGGISGAPGSEAHGAYAFCALACLCLIHEPRQALKKLDLGLLLSWLSSRQYAPEGGFAGRTNKLVDGCYSHWVGACWSLIEVAIDQVGSHSSGGQFLDTKSLCRYILSCCQADQDGGLRDKPSKPPDAYHTCYSLSGLSSVQYQHSHELPDHLPQPFGWKYRARLDDASTSAEQAADRPDLLQPLHPLFVIPHMAAQRMRDWAATAS